MRTMLQKHRTLSVLGFTAMLSLALTSCSISQPYIDTDGIYNNEKYKPVETHENKEYYSKYFEEKKKDTEHFTDIESYSSYSVGSPAWGDTSSETIVYNYGNGFYNDWMSPWGFGWNSPYYSWGWGGSLGLWGYPYYGFGAGYYGWNSPYYAWGYPYYGYGRNVSYASNHRTSGNRYITPANRSTNTRLASRQLNNSTLANSRNISNSRFNNTNNNRSIQNTTRNQSINNNRMNTRDTNINRSSSPSVRQSSTPSRGSFGGGFNGGGRSTSGGRR